MPMHQLMEVFIILHASLLSTTTEELIPDLDRLYVELN